MSTFVFLLLTFTQIVTESLPISSSGHMKLLAEALPAFGFSLLPLPEVYEYVLQGPTSLILIFFWREWWIFLLKNANRCKWLLKKMAFFVLCAEVPTLICYFILQVRTWPVPLWIGFATTALLLLSLFFLEKEIIYKKNSEITLDKAIIIGFVQGLALIPGISRLGSTYVVGRWLGLSALTSFGFSCAIEWPLITAAFLKGIVAFGSVRDFFAPIIPLLAATFLLASIVAYGVLNVTFAMMCRGHLWLVGVYMLVPTFLAFIFVFC